MKNIFYLALLATVVMFSACNKDDDTGHNHSGDSDTDFEYHATIMSPSTDDKNVGDAIHIHVDFSSHASETIHHVNVRIYNKSTGLEIYNAPETAHIHETSGEYGYHDDFVLSNENNVEAHSDWILEAKVWGHEAGVGEVIEMVEFHVHP